MNQLSPRLRTLAALPAVVLAGMAVLTGCADPGTEGSAGQAAAPAENGIVYNLSPEQDRIRAEKDDALAAAVPAAIADDGKLTVGTTAASVPLTFHATDNKTPIGAEVDIAQLVADTLGLELDVQVTAWENWPLKTQSGDFEAVFSNVGINADRVKLFDFASYRGAFMGFEARTDASYDIRTAQDISGLKVSVGSGTNQEKILLAWNAELEAAGTAPAELLYYGNDADTILALSSGRTDVNLTPYPTAVYRANTREDLKIVGKVNAGWPNETLVAATTLRGNGLAEVVTQALNAVIADGSYAEVLERWGLAEEAIATAETITAETYVPLTK